MARDHSGLSADVHALVDDLLPVLVPGARLLDEPHAVVLWVRGAAAQISTRELVDRCSRLPQHRWPRTVEDWLRRVGEEAVIAVAESRLAGDPHDRLRVVLAPRDRYETTADLLPLVSVPFGRYFTVHAVVDDGERVRLLTRLRAALLGLCDVGHRAVGNTVDHELPSLAVRVQQLTLREHATVVTLPGSPYVSAALMDLPGFLPGPCPHGALVGAPRSSMLLLHPVVSRRALEFLPAFAEITAEMYASAAGERCSPSAYWWTPDDALLEVPVLPGADSPEARTVMPPELDDLVRRLPDDPGR